MDTVTFAVLSKKIAELEAQSGGGTHPLKTEPPLSLNNDTLSLNINPATAENTGDYFTVEDGVLKIALGTFSESDGALTATDGLVDAPTVAGYLTTIANAVEAIPELIQMLIAAYKIPREAFSGEALTLKGKSEFYNTAAVNTLAINAQLTSLTDCSVTFKTGDTPNISILTNTDTTVLWHGDPVEFEANTVYELDFRILDVGGTRTLLIAGGALTEAE